MAVQTNGDMDTDEAKAAQADGNKGDGSFGYRSPERLAAVCFGSDRRRSMSGPHFIDPETALAAQVIVQSIAGFMLFVAAAAVGKLL